MPDEDPSAILKREEPVTDDELIDAANEVVEVAKRQARKEATSYSAGYAGGIAQNVGPTNDDIASIDEMVEWIVPHYEGLKTPLPKDFEVLAEAMSKIEEQLAGTGNSDDELSFGNPDLSSFKSASSHMEEWDGKLATNFRDDYLNKFPAITSNQGKVAHYLRHSSTVMAQVYERRRRDALMNAKYAVDALEATDDCKSSDLKILLAVTISLGTLITGVGAIFSSVVVPATVIGGAGIIGGTMPGAFDLGTEEMPLAADTVDGVLNNLSDVLTESDKKMVEEEDDLLDKLKNTELELYPLVTDKPTPTNAVVPIIPDVGGASGDEIVGRGKNDPLDGLTQIDDSPDDDDGNGDGDGDGGDGDGDGGDGNGDGDGDGDGGSGSYFGPNPPDDFDGAVNDTGGDRRE